MKRLEALRLELDSRRRTVSDLQARCERARASLGTTRARGEVELEVSLRKMQHKEDKMQREWGDGPLTEQRLRGGGATVSRGGLPEPAASAAAVAEVWLGQHVRRWPLRPPMFAPPPAAAAPPRAPPQARCPSTRRWSRPCTTACSR
jgi:hypothetical protein